MAKKSKKIDLAEGEGGLVYSTAPETMEALLGSLAPIETLPAARQQLRVRLDTKARKGKVVTVVTGFTGSDDDLEALAKRLKAACGVGGSAKEGEVIVQGSLVDKVIALLKEWGYSLTRKG